MKSLPANPNLEFLKKEAKALRALHKQGDPSCCEQIRLFDTSYKNKSDSEILATRFPLMMHNALSPGNMATPAGQH